MSLELHRRVIQAVIDQYLEPVRSGDPIAWAHPELADNITT